MSKWKKYNDTINEVISEGNSLGWSKIAREVFNRHGIVYQDYDVDVFRTYIKRNFTQSIVGNVQNKEVKHTPITNSLDAHNLKNKDWDMAWIKENGISIKVRNPKAKRLGDAPTELSLNDIRKDFIETLLNHSPSYKDTKLINVERDSRVLVIDIADLHIGKLSTISESGDKYDVETAVSRARQSVDCILDESKGLNIQQVVFVIGNDILHTDNINGQTTVGTNQDTDGMWFDNYKIARELYVDIIERLSHNYKVHIVHCPSNHDFMSGYMLADSVYAWLHKHPNITWDITSRHRKYFKFGENLLGFSHGDGAKLDLLPLLMAEESKELWATTKFRTMFLHHLHHMKKFKFQTGSDFPGVTVRYLRSPSGTDSWHHKNGYQHAPKAVEAFIYDYKSGPKARFTYTF